MNKKDSDKKAKLIQEKCNTVRKPEYKHILKNLLEIFRKFSGNSKEILLCFAGNCNETGLNVET